MSGCMGIGNSNVCAGIVLYNPEPDALRANITALLPQVSAIVLVDNGSRNIAQIMAEWEKTPGIAFVLYEENRGVAAALNSAMLWAEQNGYDWLVTMDQDSQCPPAMVAAFLPFTEQSDVGIICPCLKVKGITKKIKSVPEIRGDFQLVDTCITSAGLTRVAAWRKIGGFNEWLFIDQVDFEFDVRLRRAGWQLIQVNSQTLVQPLGNTHEYRIGRLKFSSQRYSPMRNYYQVRNQIYMRRAYPEEAPKKFWWILLRIHLLKRLILDPQRGKTITSFLHGLRDGLKAPIKE